MREVELVESGAKEEKGRTPLPLVEVDDLGAALGDLAVLGGGGGGAG
jgi:hypothetical protein